MTRGRTIGVVALVVLATVAGAVGVVAGAGQSAVADADRSSVDADRTRVAASGIHATGGAPLAATNGTTTRGGTTGGANATNTNATRTTTTQNGSVDATVDASNGTISPGARLAGLIGARQAEHRGAVETRALAVRFERAETNASDAAIVANATERIEERIAALEDRLETVERRYENGTISRGTYYGRVTSLTARIEALERMANRTVAHARALPAPALRAHGVDVTEVAALANRTRGLGSSRAAAIAKRVAGPAVGRPVGTPPGRPNGSVGPPGRVGTGPGSHAGETPPDHAGPTNRTRGPTGGQNGTTDQGAADRPTDRPSDVSNATIGPPSDAGAADRAPQRNASRGQGRDANRSDPVAAPPNRTADGPGEPDRPRPPERANRSDRPDRSGTTGADNPLSRVATAGLDLVSSLLGR
ncbi:MAG: hypothetical protein ABEJ77_06135 [Halanaeroarchaeum sp.]